MMWQSRRTKQSKLTIWHKTLAFCWTRLLNPKFWLNSTYIWLFYSCMTKMGIELKWQKILNLTILGFWTKNASKRSRLTRLAPKFCLEPRKSNVRNWLDNWQLLSVRVRSSKLHIHSKMSGHATKINSMCLRIKQDFPSMLNWSWQSLYQSCIRQRWFFCHIFISKGNYIQQWLLVGLVFTHGLLRIQTSLMCKLASLLNLSQLERRDSSFKIIVIQRTKQASKLKWHNQINSSGLKSTLNLWAAPKHHLSVSKDSWMWSLLIVKAVNLRIVLLLTSTLKRKVRDKLLSTQKVLYLTNNSVITWMRTKFRMWWN